jgi:uncharacterized membrane protein
MIRLAAFLILLPLCAAAQSLPALHDVMGVAADDVLNIRAGPSASEPVVGTLAPDAEGVEVVALDAGGAWGRVNTGERSGWASMAYLERQPEQEDGALPVPMGCFGTEPFWSLRVAGSGLVFEGVSIDRVETSLATRTRASGLRGRYGFVGWGAGETSGMHGIVRREACSDGMSDRLYGLSLDLLVSAGGTLNQYAGCCSLAR